MRAAKPFSIAIIVAAASLFGCDGGEASADLDGYRIGPGDREITVVYVQGPSDSPGRVKILEESSKSVKVKVLFRGAKGSQNALGVIREATGTLKEPLGDREVLNESGKTLPRK